MSPSFGPLHQTCIIDRVMLFGPSSNRILIRLPFAGPDERRIARLKIRAYPCAFLSFSKHGFYGLVRRSETYFQFRDAGLRIRKALLGVTLTRGPTVNLRLRDFKRLLGLLGAGQIPDVLAMFLLEFRFELADAGKRIAACIHS